MNHTSQLEAFIYFSNSGSGSGSGSGFRFRIPVPDSGSGFRFRIPVPDSGSGFRFRIPVPVLDFLVFHTPVQSHIRLDQSNIRLTLIELKCVAFN